MSSASDPEAEFDADAAALESAIARILDHHAADPSRDVSYFLDEHVKTLRRRLDSLRALGFVGSLDAEVTSDLPMPSRVHDRFRVVGLIGRGGMGDVYLAIDELLGRRVALKVQRAIKGHDPVGATSRLARFRREAEITAQLDHPGVVPVYDYGRLEDGRVFYSMKFVAGRTVEDIVNACGRGDSATLAEFPLERRLAVVERVCETLAFAHSRGVVHRDIKPENVIVGSYGAVHLLDWGVAYVKHEAHSSAATEAAKIVVASDPDAKTLDGVLLGTPAYMAPEQRSAAHGAIDGRTDVFLVGALLYRLLAAASPQATSAFLATRSSAADRAFSRLPRALRAIILKATASASSARYADMDQLIADLRAFRESRPGRAWRETPLSWVIRLVRRHATATVILLAASAVVVTGLLAFNVLREARAAALASEIERRVAVFRQASSQLLPTEDVDGVGPTRIDHLGYLDRVEAAIATLGLEFESNPTVDVVANWRSTFGSLPLPDQEAVLDRLGDIVLHLELAGIRDFVTTEEAFAKGLAARLETFLLRRSSLPPWIPLRRFGSYAQARALLSAFDGDSQRLERLRQLQSVVTEPEFDCATHPVTRSLPSLQFDWAIVTAYAIGSRVKLAPGLEERLSAGYDSPFARYALTRILVGKTRTVDERERAVRYGSALRSRFPSDKACAAAFARALLSAEQRQAAIPLLLEAIETCSRPVLLLKDLARGYAALGDYGAARQALDRAIQLDDESPLLFQERMLVHAKQGSQAAALADLAACQSFGDPSAEAWYAVLMELIEQGRLDAVERMTASASRAIKAKPEYTAVLAGLSRARGRPELGIASLQAVLRRLPVNPECRYELVMSMLAMGDVPGAKSAAEGLPEDHPYSARAFESLADHISRADPTDPAILTSLRACLRSDPRRHIVRVRLIEALVRMRDEPAAALELRKLEGEFVRPEIRTGEDSTLVPVVTEFLDRVATDPIFESWRKPARNDDGQWRREAAEALRDLRIRVDRLK